MMCIVLRPWDATAAAGRAESVCDDVWKQALLATAAADLRRQPNKKIVSSSGRNDDDIRLPLVARQGTSTLSLEKLSIEQKSYSIV